MKVKLRAKRMFDLVLSSFALLLLSPLLVLLVLLVRGRLGSPVLFKQVRPGLHGHPFTIYKFRSMTNERGADGELLPDEVRLTPFGKFLRSSSLDELPELFNVIKGDMSLVGPRPLAVVYLERYSSEQARRHDVLPGITGLAQVSGRNAISWQERFAFDVWYVDNMSLWLDLKILWRTVLKVLKRDGINAEGHATTHNFLGNEETPRTSDTKHI